MTATQSTALPAPTTQAPPQQAPAPVAESRPRPFRYTLERYHEAIEAGVLTENDRIELIHGELIEKMSIGKRHADCVDDLIPYFTNKFGQTHRYRVQNPVTLPPNSEPEPDFAIINRETYKTRAGKPEPVDVLLLIEVADESLAYDRGGKAQMYAAAGIAEYWIINLQHDQVELHTQPNTTTGVYDSIQRFGKDSSFASPFCGDVTVAELLPE